MKKGLLIILIALVPALMFPIASASILDHVSLSGSELSLILVLVILVCVVIALVAYMVYRNKAEKKSTQAQTSNVAQQHNHRVWSRLRNAMENTMKYAEEQQITNICPYCGKPIVWYPRYQRFVCSFGCEREAKYF